VLPFLFWLSLLVLMSNVIFYNLYGFLIKKYGPTFVSLSGFLCPVFSTFFEWLLMNGTITWHHFFALFCITTGLFIFYKE
jgi:drug/metabolite transporter (DMT)-like permease